MGGDGAETASPRSAKALTRDPFPAAVIYEKAEGGPRIACGAWDDGGIAGETCNRAAKINHKGDASLFA